MILKKYLNNLCFGQIVNKPRGGLFLFCYILFNHLQAFFPFQSCFNSEHNFLYCVSLYKQQVQHVYPTQVQYVGESGEAVYTNGTM